MKIKSYFASSVEQAIQNARTELGGDATLITTRRAAPEVRHLGAYEVVFGTAPAATGADSPQPEDLNAELAMLRDQLDSIKRLLRLNASGGSAYARPEIGQLYEQVLSAGFEENWARQITEEAAAAFQNLPPAERSSTSLSGMAAECIRKKLRFAPESTSPPAESSRTVVLIGPPGAGKTTTLTKIAIQECLARRRSLRIVSVDLHRVGAHEKLRAYAGIIGAGFTAVNTAAEFLEATEEFRNKNVLLVDTPGYGGRDWEWARDLAGLLAKLERRETHLVLPASVKPADLLRFVHSYADFNFDYLLFTKLDETESFGSIVSATLQADKPISYFTRGQGIPEDLEAASWDGLACGLFQSEKREATSAA